MPEDEADARTIMKQRTFNGHLTNLDKLEGSYGVQKALQTGNIAAVEKYTMIQTNKQKANEFLRT